MLTFWTPFSYKWETLKKIWLSVHFKQQVTQAHVIECDLDGAIEDIISSPQTLGLRLCGSLLLGVAQIFSRKANYLLTDCSHALDKLKLSFRPDAPYGTNSLSCEGFEAAVKEIPLSEDFSLLSDPSDFNMDMDIFSQNQSHPDEITLKEYSDMSQCNIGQLAMDFQSLGHPQDLFGDEGARLEMCLDFLTYSGTHSDFTDSTPLEILNDIPHEYSLNHQHDGKRRDHAEKEKSLDQSPKEQTTFALLPVPDTCSRKKKRGRRKRMLIVDQMTILTDKAMRMQLSDDSDLVVSLIMAPPTRQLMYWKESGTAVNLLMQPCSGVIGSEIKEAFPKDVIQVTYEEEEAVMRQDDHEADRNMSPLSIESLEDSSTEDKHTDVIYSSNNLSDLELKQDEHRSDAGHPKLPSEDSMFVHQSQMEQHSQSLLGSQNFGEKQAVYQQAHMLLKSLQWREDTSFCLRDLCSGNTRMQVARTFHCFLVLQKEGAVSLHQSEPYQDIFVTPGPAFFLLENAKTDDV
ncbi:double-strand-break repair protein rad21-like protein 1 isoform X1 [Hippocampus comes]|uniref:double-strand-break repair protein rad21-like protein 1 isoform X1 n=1 Tax=Hippocampus comes TaxID=109280 RepID=UPI00094E3A59|nr:PREDICTED: double-strand-break repair protein rad21 homolog isoform X1 [Hippocampus comes]